MSVNDDSRWWQSLTEEQRQRILRTEEWTNIPFGGLSSEDYVPGHEYMPSGWWVGRRGLAELAIWSGLWQRLPGRVQGWLCGCLLDRGWPVP